MKTDITELINKTIQLAAKNVKKKKCGPFAAIVIKDGKIVSSAYNRVTLTNDPTAHAEVEAIRKASKKLKTFDLSGCEIFSSCQPCPMCLSAIYWAKIKRIYCCADKKTAAKYGFRDEMILKELRKNDKNQKVKLIFVENNNKELPFETWEKLPGKKKY